MKYYLLLIFVVMLFAWHMSARRPEHFDCKPWSSPPRLGERARARHHTHSTIARTSQELREAIHETGHEVGEAWSELGQDLRQSLHQVAEDIRDAVDDDFESAPPALPQLPERVLAEEPLPPRSPASPGQRPTAGASSAIREVTGEISYNEERAKDEARAKLNQEVTTWLEANGVPKWWKPAPGLVDALIVETSVKPVVKDYGTLYQAKLRADFSPRNVAPFKQSYQRQLVHRRIVLLGSGLAFVLCCLAALAGYIRADEATKGYYTNRLRVLATACVAAAGVAIYKFMV